MNYRHSLLTVLVALTVTAVAAQQQLVIIESGETKITSDDSQAELLRAPADVRARLLENRDAMAQLASNLLIRRVLAKQAEKAGLHQQPSGKAALALARDRILSDLQLLSVDEKAKPSLLALEMRAREIHRADVQRFVVAEQIRASHVLIKKGEGALEKARDILTRAKQGADFTELARQNSDDPGSATKGGDLGLFGRGRMLRPFEQAAFGLQPGEISDLVETDFGYHIIKLTERLPSGKKAFEEVKDTLYKEITQQILNENRVRIGQEIMTGAKPKVDQLEVFLTTQKR